MTFTFCFFYFPDKSFIKAKSEVHSEDVKQLLELGLEVFHAAQNKLYAQVSISVSLIIE